MINKNRSRFTTTLNVVMPCRFLNIIQLNTSLQQKDNEIEDDLALMQTIAWDVTMERQYHQFHE